MSSLNALQKLKYYSSTDDSDEDVDQNKSKNETLKIENINETKRLPVPSLDKFTTKTEEIENDPNQHQGKIRSFPHQRGNWATYAFIKYDTNEDLISLVNELIQMCKPDVDLFLVDHFHISLTRTVILKYHWINSFVNTIKRSIASLKEFIVMFNNIKVFCNEERTRTFLSFAVEYGHENLCQMVNILDSCLTEYQLPTFYKDRKFHMSIAWCVGDETKVLNKYVSNMNQCLIEAVKNSEDILSIDVNKVFCKIGNKEFEFGVR